MYRHPSVYVHQEILIGIKRTVNGPKKYYSKSIKISEKKSRVNKYFQRRVNTQIIMTARKRNFLFVAAPTKIGNLIMNAINLKS